MVTSTLEHSAGVTTGHARWSTLASTALLLTASGPLIMLAAATLWGLSVADELPFFLGTAVVAGAGSQLVRRPSTGLRILGIVAGLLAGLSMFWTAFGLFEPASVLDFVPGLVVLPGALLGVGAGIAAVRAQRRGDLVDGLVDGERSAVRGVLAGVAVLAVLSTGLTFAGRETVSDDVDVAATVVLSDFEFPSDVSVPGGQTVLVRNNDPLTHTFTVDDLDLDVKLGPGSESFVTIPARAGTYVLYSAPHTTDPDDPTDDDMAATLTVG